MKLNYRKEIDFLRALAVTFVIIFHFYPSFLPNGYLGVDMFFVISGFLISYQIFISVKDKKILFKGILYKKIKTYITSLYIRFSSCFYHFEIFIN